MSSRAIVVQQLQLYMSRTNFPVTKDVTKMMQPIKGCKPDEKDVDVFAGGGLSNPKPVVPEAGLLLVFNTVGGVPELQVQIIKQKHVKGYSSRVSSNEKFPYT